MPGRNKAAPHLSRNVLGVQLWVWLMAQRASGSDRSLSFTGAHRRAQHLLGDARTRHTPARTQERGKEGRRDLASLPVQRVWPADVLGWAGRERGSGLVVGRSEAGPPCAHESQAAGTRGELWRRFRSAEPGHRLQSLQEAAGTLPLEPRHGRRQPRRPASQGRAWVSGRLSMPRPEGSQSG